MSRLVYAPICSLDGYVEDASGSFDWAAPDEEVHAFANDLERAVSTQLYGRRMWETMRYWQDDRPDDGEVERKFAQVWRAAEKVVFSRTLDAGAAPRVVREFDRSLVQELKAAASGEVSVGGAELAGVALRAGLVDEVRMIVVPVAVGGGKPALPLGLRLDLRLTGTRAFANGTVCLSYDVRTTS